MIPQGGSQASLRGTYGGTYNSGPSQPSTVRPDAQDVDDDAAPGIPPPIPPDDPTSEAQEQDSLEPASKSGQRGVVDDGDPNFPAEPAAVVDGDVDTEEQSAPQDGTDMSAVATRDDGDVGLFENPPAGYDPLLFQIEDLNPYTDNRTTRRLFRQEPYDPVGIKVGSFVLFPELEFGTSYYSNVFHAPGSPSDWAMDVKPAARLVSNWSTNALEFRAVGVLSYYNEFQTEDDRDYTLEARGRLDVTKRANIQALISRQQYLEDRSALDASSVGTRSVVDTDRAELAYNQRFNRLSYQLRGTVQDYTYGPTEDAGVVTSNQDRDYTIYEETLRTSWELKPSLSPYFEFAYNHRDYGEAARSDGINRTSDGQRYRFGVSFGNTGEILRGDVSLGYGIQTPESSLLHAVEGLTIDANATWRATGLTSVLFNAVTDVSETTTADVGGAFSHWVGVEVLHQLRSYLVASAGIIYYNQSSQDGIINDTQWAETAGLEYYADRNTVLFGKYEHVDFNGVGVPNDYIGDEFHLGVRLRQ